MGVCMSEKPPERKNRYSSLMESKELDRVSSLLEKHPKGITIDEVARLIPLNRSTAAKYLDILTAQGKSEIHCYGRTKVYSISDRVPLTQMLSLSPDLILIINGDCVMSHANHQFLTFFGIRHNDIAGRSYDLSPLAPFLDLSFDILRSVMSGEEVERDLEIPLDGESRIFKVRIVPVIFESGEHGIALVLQDVTTLKRSQIELEMLVDERTRELLASNQRLKREVYDHENARIQLSRSEKSYRGLVNALQEGVWVFSMNGITEFVNSRMASMLLYSPGEILGRNIFTFLGEKGIIWLRDRLESGIRDFSEQDEVEMIRSDGTRITTLISLAPIDLHESETPGLVAGVVDITSRKYTEELIRETRDRLNSIIDACPLAIIALDIDGLVTIWNPEAVRVFGWSAEEVIGKPLPTIPRDLREEYVRNFSMALRGEPIAREVTRRMRRDGSSIDIELFTAPLHASDGSVIGTFVIYSTCPGIRLSNIVNPADQ